jgi:O-antigen ligase
MHTNKLDRKYYFIYTALIFLALGLMVSPTIVAGYHIFITIPAFLIFWKYKNEIKVPKSSYILIAISVWGLTSAFYNLDTLIKPLKSFQDVKYYLLGVLCIYPLKYFLEQGSKRHLKVILNILCITIIIAFFVGISKSLFQFNIVKMSFGDYHNRSGGFVNYMRYGYASALLFILGLNIFLNRTNDKVREIITPKLFYPALLLCFLAIGTSQCRGALLSVLASLPFLLWRYKPKVTIILLFLGSIFAAMVIYFSFISQSTKYRFLNINQGSNAVRVSQWQTALSVISEKPLLGLGPDQFSYNVKEYKTKYKIKYDYYSSHAHNILLEHGANYGIPGMVLLIIFFILWFIEMMSMKSVFGWAVGSYLIAFFVGGQVELLFDVINSHLLFFIYSFSQAMKK